MNKAERLIISEKFEDVILSIPDSRDGKGDRYVLSKAVQAFRNILKAL